MTAYMPALIWLFSAIICLFIANKRNVKPKLIRSLIVLFLGPLAIPLALFVKPDTDISS
jgi:hypothetical protein